MQTSDALSNQPHAVVSFKPVAFLIFVLAASLGYNVFLTQKYARLLRPPTATPPIIGKILPALKAQTITGNAEVVNYTGQSPTIFYVLSPTCTWCARNFASIRMLARERASSYRFIGIALNDTGISDYVRTNDLGFPVFKLPAPEFVSAAGLNATPQTIVVAPGGKVIQSWVGAYRGQVQAGVEAFFHFKLPAIPEPPKSAESIHTNQRIETALLQTP